MLEEPASHHLQQRRDHRGHRHVGELGVHRRAPRGPAVQPRGWAARASPGAAAALRRRRAVAFGRATDGPEGRSAQEIRRGQST